MILPLEQFSNAVKYGKLLLDKPEIKIVYAHENGCVLEYKEIRLSIRKQPPMAAFGVINVSPRS